MSVMVSELFTSLQGEGSAQGLACAFVRLAGCPLRCRWCDTVYARDGGDPMEIKEILRWVRDQALPLVEITGGEPLAQEQTPDLARALLGQGPSVLCETSGAFDIGVLPGGVVRVMDLKPPSSGESGRMRPDNIALLRPADDVKLVIADRGDYEWALARIAEYRLFDRCHVLLQAATPLLAPAELAAWVLADRLPARVQVQLHKVLWPGEGRGR